MALIANRQVKSLSYCVLFVLACVVLIGLPVAQAYAQSQSDLESIYNDTTFYDPLSSSCPDQTNATNSVTTGSPITGVDLTAYSPQQGGDAIEGGYASSRPGIDGQSLVRTLDDVRLGASTYVTLAGDPSLYGKKYTIPTVTYNDKAGTSHTLTNVTAYVHDTGSAFTGKPEGRYDVAVGKDYSDSVMNSEPFGGKDKIQLIASPAVVATSATPATSSLTSGSLYILGDSITVRGESAYRTKFGPNITPFINASVGRSWKGGGITSQSKTSEGSYKPGKDAVVDDNQKIKDAAGIVIALGTNNGVSFNPIAEIFDTIRTINTTAPIWWVNTAASSAQYTLTGPFNTELANNQPIKKYTIVNWAKLESGKDDPGAMPSADVGSLLDSDGVHPNASGVDKLTDLVVQAVKNGTGAVQQPSSGGCATAPATLLSGADNEQKVWNYLALKGLKPHQIAGFMGNMMAEAHFEPRLTEYAFSDPPHLSDTVPGDVNSKGQPGYGIIQWTAPGRKQGLRDIAAAQGKSTGDLGLQLDYMWQELNGPYKGTLDFVLASKTVEAATDYICRHYEIPSGIDAAVIKRTAFAKDFLIKYGSVAQ